MFQVEVQFQQGLWGAVVTMDSGVGGRVTSSSFKSAGAFISAGTVEEVICADRNLRRRLPS